MEEDSDDEGNAKESKSFWRKNTRKLKNAIMRVKARFSKARPQFPRRGTEMPMGPIHIDEPHAFASMSEMESPTWNEDAIQTTTQTALSLEGTPVIEKNLHAIIENVWQGMIRRAKELTRKKDFLHLVLSYTMKPEADGDVDFQSLRGLFCHMNQQARQLQALLLDNFHDKQGDELGELANKEISQGDFRAVENVLSKYDFHMVAYLPQEADTSPFDSWRHRIEVGLTGQTTGKFEAPDEMLTMAIESAIRQVLNCIEDINLRKIGISGTGGEKVVKALKEIPFVRAKCSIILCVSVSQYHSTKEIEQNIAAQIRGPDKTFKGSLDELLPQDFFLLLDCVDMQIDLHDLKIPNHGIVVLTSGSQNVYGIMGVDLEIRMEDHLLPWKLFCRNVGSSLVNYSPSMQQLALRFVKECHGHLLAIVLLARALKDVPDVGMWEIALHELTSQSSGHVQGMSEVMVHVLNFIWDRKDIRSKYCIKHLLLTKGKQRQDSLLSSWILNGLVESDREVKFILEDLIQSFLVEKDGEGYVRMREETKIVLQNCFIPHLPSLHLREGGLGLKTWDAMEIYLRDNKLSELPENPKCSALNILWLDNNFDLMEIPQLFFQDMPLLHSLDLSYTSIKSLPPSISRLVSLQTLNLRGCELLIELPPEIRALKNLEVFDLEGTEIMYLPEEIGELTNLRCFRVSLSGHANRYRVTKQRGTTIPEKVLSKLSQLVALSIDVNPDGEWWDADVKAILNELSRLKWLKKLELYLPSVELLQQLRWDSGGLMYPDLLQFRITVGYHPQRIISRLPHEVEAILNKWEKSKKCLKYVNGEGIPTEITEALNHASIFYLDRHWTVKTLSQFGNEMMVKLEFCLLVECNELRTVIDGNYKCTDGVHKKPVFGQLQYLGIHYMKNLESIWNGPRDEGSLSNLRTLALHTCPSLTTIFTAGLLGNLDKLEKLILEDCPKIRSLIGQESSGLKPGPFLQSLKKIALLDLPELVSISGGISIGPTLESLVVYNCPKLDSLYTMEVSSTDLKIKGEEEWWDTLKWHESEWSSCTRPAFEKLRRGEDLIDQLENIVYSH